MTRRDWMLSTAALPAAAARGAQSNPKNIVVSSGNGARACARAMELLKAGADTLDAVIAGVNINEEDPEDTSVGYGGLPNEEGVVELDASVMHGPTRRAGSVASIRNIKTPSKVAKLVMEQTDHVMLVGDGALRFAKAMGLRDENLITEKSRLAWLVWKQSLRDASGHNNWTDGLDAPSAPAKPSAQLRRLFPEADDETLAWLENGRAGDGTINCLALNTPGDVGPPPPAVWLKILGRGRFAHHRRGLIWIRRGRRRSTGRGEENIRVSGAHSSSKTCHA